MPGKSPQGLSKAVRFCNNGLDAESLCKSGEEKPLLGDSRADEPDQKDLMRMTSWVGLSSRKWTPKTSVSVARWWVLVVSAFANMGPVGLLVVSRPQGGIATSIFAIFVFGGLSLFGSHLIACALTISGCYTLPELWRDVVGPLTAWIPMVAVSFTCFAICIGYLGFYGHMLAFIWPSPLSDSRVSAEDFYVLVSTFPLLMLVCLKDISVMRFSTLVCLMGCVLTNIMVIIRYADGTYTGEFNGGTLSTVSNIGNSGPWFEPSSRRSLGDVDKTVDVSDFWGYSDQPTRIFSIEAVLFLFHFNAAKYFRELEQPKTDRYTQGVGLAMMLGFINVLFIMVFVFLTFGHRTALLTLDNYRPNDHLINIARFAMSMALLGCFPLLFAGMREALIELLTTTFPKRDHIFTTVGFQNGFSACLLAGVIVIGCISHKTNLVLINIGRSAFGSLLIYVIPGIVYIGACRKSGLYWKISTWQIIITIAMGILGLVISASSMAIWLAFASGTGPKPPK